MADEEDEVEELPVVTAAAEKKQNPFIPIIAAAVVAAGLAFAVVKFLLIPDIHAVNAEHGGDGPEAQKKAVEQILAAKTYNIEGITANLSGELRGRYIKVSLMLEGTNPEFENIMKKSEAKIKDATLKTLTTLDIRSASQEGIIGILSGQLISTINKNLEPAPHVVEKLFFSEFIIQ